MKAIIVSDPHIGDYPYGKIDSKTGLNSRLLDFLHNFDQIVQVAIDEKVDIFIIVGDIYRVKHPNSKIRRQFASRVKPLLLNGIKTILMTGNHDMTISSDNAHAMSEMEELSDLIDSLEVYSEPKVIKVKNTELYILPFVNRGKMKLLTVDDFNKFQANKIEEFNVLTKKSDVAHKLFFGHFGTDKSVVGNSFDLNMAVDEAVIKTKIFKEGLWSKVYLGHIHQQQEFDNVMRHVGSMGRVDFAEAQEQKGFYFYEDGKDEFRIVNDRKFKTFHLDLTVDCKSKMKDFLDKIQDKNLLQTIVKVKVDISQTNLSQIRFEGLESYLKENAWHFTGVDINIIQSDEHEDEKEIITSIDLPIDALEKYILSHPDNFKDIEEDSLSIGKDIILGVLSYE